MLRVPAAVLVLPLIIIFHALALWPSCLGRYLTLLEQNADVGALGDALFAFLTAFQFRASPVNGRPGQAP